MKRKTVVAALGKVKEKPHKKLKWRFICLFAYLSLAQLEETQRHFMRCLKLVQHTLTHTHTHTYTYIYTHSLSQLS